MTHNQTINSYVLCINDGGYPESLEVRKVYAVLTDERAATNNYTFRANELCAARLARPGRPEAAGEGGERPDAIDTVAGSARSGARPVGRAGP